MTVRDHRGKAVFFLYFVLWKNLLNFFHNIDYEKTESGIHRMFQACFVGRFYESEQYFFRHLGKIKKQRFMKKPQHSV